MPSELEKIRFFCEAWQDSRKRESLTREFVTASWKFENFKKIAQERSWWLYSMNNLRDVIT